MLVYPVTDHDFTTASHLDPGDDKVLQSKEVQYFWQEYLADAADASQPYASPLRAPSLAALPPALVITAGFDPLRDEGEAYAAKLSAAGVSTELVRYDTMMHSFVTFLDALPDAFRQAVWLRDVEEFSYAEIARMLEVPIGTVMSRISRGRRMLFERLAGSRAGEPTRVAR